MIRKISSVILFFIVLSVQAQYTDSKYTITVSNLSIPEGQTSATAGTYDRIEMTRTVPAGEYTALAVASTVDGYFFGIDAERYVIRTIEQASDGNYDVFAEKMDDLADFQPGTLYLVKPTLAAETVYSYTAGIKTAVSASNQRSLDCYQAPKGSIAYTVAGDGKVLTIDSEDPIIKVDLEGMSSVPTLSEGEQSDGNWWIADGETKTATATFTAADQFTGVYVHRLGYERALTSGNIGTICLPNAVNADDLRGVELYSIAGCRKTEGVPTSVLLVGKTEMEAGVPYVIRAATDKLVAAYTGNAVAQAGNNNGLYGTFEDFQNNNYGNIFVFSNQVIKRLSETGWVRANKAYLLLDDIPEYTGSEVKGMSFAIEGVATGIDDLQDEHAGETYDLMGRRIQQPTRGLYIKNGVKYLKH